MCRSNPPGKCWGTSVGPSNTRAAVLKMSGQSGRAKRKRNGSLRSAGVYASAKKNIPPLSRQSALLLPRTGPPTLVASISAERFFHCCCCCCCCCCTCSGQAGTIEGSLLLLLLLLLLLRNNTTPGGMCQRWCLDIPGRHVPGRPLHRPIPAHRRHTGCFHPCRALYRARAPSNGYYRGTPSRTEYALPGYEYALPRGATPTLNLVL